MLRVKFLPEKTPMLWVKLSSKKAPYFKRKNYTQKNPILWVKF